MSDEIGAALIARLARDRQHAQRGLGAWLLQQALLRIVHADAHLAVRAVLVDALNEGAAGWYRSWGFALARRTRRPPVARVRASLGR